MEEMATLLNTDTSDTDLMEEIYDTAFKIKERIYGNRIVLFAPLYLANYCVNNCAYCAFRVANKNIERSKLTDADIRREVEALQQQVGNGVGGATWNCIMVRQWVNDVMVQVPRWMWVLWCCAPPQHPHPHLLGLYDLLGVTTPPQAMHTYTPHNASPYHTTPHRTTPLAGPQETVGVDGRAPDLHVRRLPARAGHNIRRAQRALQRDPPG